MIRQTFDDAITWLAKYYNYNLSDERKDRYWDEFKGEDDKLFSDVIAQDIANKLKVFPTPQEIREHLAFRRERAYEAQKHQELRDRQPIQHMPSRNQHSIDWKNMLVNGLFRRTASVESRLQHLQELEAMHERYPHAGYGKVASENRKWWTERGMLTRPEPVVPSHESD